MEFKITITRIYKFVIVNEREYRGIIFTEKNAKREKDVVKVKKVESLTLEDILKILKEHKQEIKEKYHVTELGVFGSYVRGENTEESDVDILVEFEDDAEIGLLKFLELECYLSDLLNKKVDLVQKSALKPNIGKQILREVVYL